MNPALSLMNDLEESISRGSARRREETLRRVTDLFIRDGERLNDEQVAIFDEVIGRLAQAAGRGARVELARRLGPLERAPPRIVRSLAHDDIEVARPVLLLSRRLKVSDLVAIALACGTDHRQAIAKRREVPEPVAQVLVAQGDPSVLYALAGNRGARLSEESAALLVDRSRRDGELRRLLRARPDLLQDQVRRLLDLARAAARPTLLDPTPSVPSATGWAAEGGAGHGRLAVTGSLDYREALDTIGAITLMRSVDEEDVAGFAERKGLAEVICAIASCVGLSLVTAERLITVADPELILILAKAQGWSWTTLQSLLRLRMPNALLPGDARPLAERFGELDARVAARVLRFVRRRDRSAA